LGGGGLLTYPDVEVHSTPLKSQIFMCVCVFLMFVSV